MRAWALLLVLLLGQPAWAQEAPRIPVRSGDHAGFGRLVFDWPTAPAYRVEQEGDRVRVRFPPGALALDAVRRMPRNVLALRAMEGGVELTLVPGARLRHFRNGPKVAFDVRDAPEVGTGAPVASEGAVSGPPTPPAGGVTSGPLPAAASVSGVAVATSPRRGAAPSRAFPAASPVTDGVVSGSTPATAPVSGNAVGGSRRPGAASRAAGPEAAPSSTAASSPPPATASPNVVSPIPSAAPDFATPAQREAALPGSTPEPPSAGAMAPPPLPSAPPRPPAPPVARIEDVALPPAPPARAPVGLHLPFPAEAGAAMLRRGDSWLIVFDAAPAQPADAPLRAGVRLQALPGGGLVTLDAAAEWAGPWHLARGGDGRWLLAQGGPATAPPAIRAAGDAAGALVLPASGARRVLSVQDPVSGMPLLIGTQPAGAGLVTAPREMVELRLLETVLGVAVLARSDAVVLRVFADRFVVAADGAQQLALGGAVEPVAAPVTASRSFDFPPGGAAELASRLRAQQAGLAQAPPLARGRLRLAAAETLMALGQPQEAQAMVQLAQQEDPAVAAFPRAAWLGGAAALAAGRLEEADALLTNPNSTEAALWRALLQARQGDAGGAADALAAGRGILLGYPEALLRRVLPPAAEALAVARPELAATLLAGAELPGLDLARALLEEGQGRAAPALEAYDRLAQGRDRRGRAEAMRRAAELRLSRGELDPRAAAQALEQTLFAWRDEGTELETRQRIAALRSQGGDARGALTLLRETAGLFPDREAALGPAIQRAFLDALVQETPLGAVALHDAQPELMPQGAPGVAALALMAERLAALDLPERATALLRDAMRRAPAGEARAALGARLAALQLAEREEAAAAATLVGSAAPGLPEPLRAERAILAARAAGERDGFAALGEAGDEALAEFLAERRDFAGAAAALGRHLDHALRATPTSPPAPGLQRVVLRHAALLALAGDNAGLSRIRVARAALLSGTPAEAPFQLLATDPVRGLADLARFPAELELFRTLPSTLDRLRTAAANTR